MCKTCHGHIFQLLQRILSKKIEKKNMEVQDCTSKCQCVSGICAYFLKNKSFNLQCENISGYQSTVKKLTSVLNLCYLCGVTYCMDNEAPHGS